MFYPGYFDSPKRLSHPHSDSAVVALEHKMLSNASYPVSASNGLSPASANAAAAASLFANGSGRTHLGGYGVSSPVSTGAPGSAAFLPPTPPVSAPPSILPMDPMAAAAAAAASSAAYAAFLGFPPNFLAAANAMNGGNPKASLSSLTSMYGNTTASSSAGNVQPTSNGMYNPYTAPNSAGLFSTQIASNIPTIPTVPTLPTPSPAPLSSHHPGMISPTVGAHHHDALLMSDYYRNIAASASVSPVVPSTPTLAPSNSLTPSTTGESSSFLDSLKQLQESLKAGQAKKVAAASSAVIPGVSTASRLPTPSIAMPPAASHLSNNSQNTLPLTLPPPASSLGSLPPSAFPPGTNNIRPEPAISNGHQSAGHTNGYSQKMTNGHSVADHSLHSTKNHKYPPHPFAPPHHNHNHNHHHHQDHQAKQAPPPPPPPQQLQHPQPHSLGKHLSHPVPKSQSQKQSQHHFKSHQAHLLNTGVTPTKLTIPPSSSPLSNGFPVQHNKSVEIPKVSSPSPSPSLHIS